MKKRVLPRRLGGLVLALTLFSCLLAPAVFAKPAIPEPTAQFYVGDFANVLEPGTVDAIVNANERLEADTGAQVVVVTVDFLDGYDIADYALTLFNEWRIGDAERNNGVLLLLAIGEDNYWALQGKGLEDSLSSGLLGDLLYEYLEPDFADGNYDAGVRNVFSVLVDAVRKIYPASGDTTVLPDTPGYDENPYYEPQTYRVFRISDFVKGLAAFIFLIFIVSLLGGLRGSRRRRGFYVPPPPPFYRGPRYHRPPPPPPPPGFFGGFGGGFNHRNVGGGGYRSGGRSSFGGSGRSSGSSRSGGGGSSRGGGAGRR